MTLKNLNTVEQMFFKVPESADLAVLPEFLNDIRFSFAISILTIFLIAKETFRNFVLRLFFNTFVLENKANVDIGDEVKWLDEVKRGVGFRNAE